MRFQREITTPSPLLGEDGRLNQVGWARRPLLDCNLENVSSSRVQRLRRFRTKRWDYYGVTTPDVYFSVTIADLGYAGQVFAYLVDFADATYHEETITLPPGRITDLPRNSTAGDATFDNGRVSVSFRVGEQGRRVRAAWPEFGGAALTADVSLSLPSAHQSTVVVVPIGDRSFYYNRKINCLAARGTIQIGDRTISLEPRSCLGTLDWGRGVWPYNSFWVWVSASGFTSDGGTVGLNFGSGFGDTSAATENSLLLDGRIHKLGEVEVTYDDEHFMRPWRMRSNDGRVDLEFTPFVERAAKTNLVVIRSEVHQVFGHFEGTVTDDDGNTVVIDRLIGWAEEHHARW
ncbi:MAG: DUF2804 domain-containing protein [Actinomycetota bacterium]|nr:DUF2804 domain-containing protein [Actinomycetota bacterium]